MFNKEKNELNSTFTFWFQMLRFALDFRHSWVNVSSATSPYYSITLYPLAIWHQFVCVFPNYTNRFQQAHRAWMWW